MAERILAGTQEGLQVWRGKGNAWEELDVSLASATVDAIDGPAQRPETVYASVAGEGLCRSDDGGQRWRTVFSGNVRAVTVDPTDADVVYVGTEPIHLHRSEDGGENWEELSALQDMPSEVRAKWTYPRPPHREHVRHIFVSPDDPPGGLRLPGARRHRTHLRPRRHLRGRERGHRLSRHPPYQHHAQGSGAHVRGYRPGLLPE